MCVVYKIQEKISELVRCLVGSDMVSRQIVLTKHSTSVCINEWMRCGGDTVHPLKYLVILGQ